MLGCLPAVLAVPQRCRRERGLFSLITDKWGNLDHRRNRDQFAQRLRRLKAWVKVTPLPELGLPKLQQLIAHALRFQLTFAFPQADRTSNQVDRLMNDQERLRYAMQYFHGTEAPA